MFDGKYHGHFDEGLAGLHHPDGVCERLEVSLERGSYPLGPPFHVLLDVTLNQTDGNRLAGTRSPGDVLQAEA